MFERISRAAEKVASGACTSRRGFLSRIGQGALAVAGVIGGLLLPTTNASASTNLQVCIKKCCEARCGKGNTDCSCDSTGNAYLNCQFNCQTRGF